MASYDRQHWQDLKKRNAKEAAKITKGASLGPLLDSAIELVGNKAKTSPSDIEKALVVFGELRVTCIDYLRQLDLENYLTLEDHHDLSKVENFSVLGQFLLDKVRNHRQSRWLPSLRGAAQSGLLLAPLTSGLISHLKVALYFVSSS